VSHDGEPPHPAHHAQHQLGAAEDLDRGHDRNDGGNARARLNEPAGRWPGREYRQALDRRIIEQDIDTDRPSA
jgi:hypothetical protein